MRAKKCLAPLVSLLVGLAMASVHLQANETEKSLEARGRYLVLISGCNDCHTAGYAPRGGRVSQAEWLEGDSLGYRGPWGTTYPGNLRQLIFRFSEEEWVVHARTLETRPPMPWWSLNAMTTDDLKAIYAFIKSLGHSAAPVPAYVPPELETRGPYIQWPEPLGPG